MTTAPLCEAEFERLAVEDPDHLLRLLSTEMPAYDLTFAAEIAGRIEDSAKVRPALLKLLTHADPVVREGAIYGLGRHVDETVVAEFRRLADSDDSPSIREIAADMLAGMGAAP